MNLRLLRLPSGHWSLVAVPEGQRVERRRREALAEPGPAPFLSPLEVIQPAH